jgi:hypothetical protein
MRSFALLIAACSAERLFGAPMRVPNGADGNGREVFFFPRQEQSQSIATMAERNSFRPAPSADRPGLPAQAEWLTLSRVAALLLAGTAIKMACRKPKEARARTLLDRARARRAARAARWGVDFPSRISNVSMGEAKPETPAEKSEEKENALEELAAQWQLLSQEFSEDEKRWNGKATAGTAPA